MGIEVVPFRPEHLVRLILAPVVADIQPLLESEAYRQQHDIPGLAYTGLIDGVPMGSAGLIPHRPTVARAWALPGKDLPLKAWPAITRSALFLFNEAHKAGFKRLEILTKASSETACRFAGRLGFSNPKTLDCYFDDGSDAVLWRRLAR